MVFDVLNARDLRHMPIHTNCRNMETVRPLLDRLLLWWPACAGSFSFVAPRAPRRQNVAARRAIIARLPRCDFTSQLCTAGVTTSYTYYYY